MVEKELKMAVFATKHQRTVMRQCVLQNSKELCSSVYFKTAKNCVRVRVCYKTASLSSKREQAHRVPNMHAPCPAVLLLYIEHQHCNTTMHCTLTCMLSCPCVGTSIVRTDMHAPIEVPCCALQVHCVMFQLYNAAAQSLHTVHRA